MNIAILGQGLQSQVAAALFASVGNQVVIFESEQFVEIDLSEPGLNHLFQEQKSKGRLVHLEMITEEERLYEFVLLSGILSENLFSEHKEYLLNSIDNNTKFIILDPSKVGEAQQLSLLIESLHGDISVSSVPLLVREGRAIEDFSRPEIIIVGCDNKAKLSDIKNLFYPFNRVKDVIKVVSSREAEFSSFAGNAMLATRLSFMNEMASLAEKSDVDIDVVRECIGRDPRIGSDYLYPGCGYGGKSLVEHVAKVAEELSSRTDDLGLLETVSRINERQKDLLFRKIWRFFGGDLKHKIVAVWGVSFKPGSASIEGAPAVKLIQSLLAQSATVRAYDPWALNNLKNYFGKDAAIEICESSQDALLGADILAICTEWKEFWNPDFNFLSSSLKMKAVFDGRNIFDPKVLQEKEIKYFAIGRGKSI